MFCRHIVETLHLKGVQCIKLEQRNWEERSNTASSMIGLAESGSCVACAVEYLLPLVSVGGHVLAMKGESAAAEVQQSDYASRLLGHVCIIIHYIAGSSRAVF